MRDNCDVAYFRASAPASGRRRRRRSTTALRSGRRSQRHSAAAVRRQHERQGQQIAADELGQRHDGPRREGQFRAQAAVEPGERRDYAEDDDCDDRQRQAKEDGGIDQRGYRLAPDLGHDPGVGHVAPHHLLEAPALLARQQRRDVYAGHGAPLGVERLRQGLAAPDAAVHVVQQRAEPGIVDPPPQNVQGLNQREAGLEQCGELLVEDHELAPGKAAPPRDAAGPAQPAPPPQGEDEQPLLLQLPAQVCLVLGGIDPFDDLP